MDRSTREMCRMKVGLLTAMSGAAMTTCLILVWALTGHTPL